MEHCLTQLAPSVVESIFVKRVACFLMAPDLKPDEIINGIKNEYARMCGMLDDDEETEE